MRWLLVVAAFLGGCDYVLRIDHLAENVDALPPDVLAANCRTAELVSSADTYLAGTTIHGSDDALIADANQAALIKLYLDNIYMVGDRAAALVVHIYAVDHADACGASCGACPAATATRFQVYWSTPSWNPDQATQVDSRTGVMWIGMGATGAGDRSTTAIVDDALPATTGAVDLRVPMHAVEQVLPDAWVSYDPPTMTGRLAIQIRTDGPLVFASDERSASSCHDSRPPPSATVTLCQ
jgi:hypothetical protein